MTVSLDKWQQRVDRHFAELAKRRSASGIPLFALEHGLSDGEFKDIAELLRSRLKSGRSLAPHWLLWTIYSAEMGYTYDGGEYWQSFEESTPSWDSSDRYKVSAWFLKFQKIYSGVVPSGKWASHFRIIAGPITHAILPRYLQKQFARTLYHLRFSLARLPTINAIQIGRLIANNAYNASSRFEQFLQQEELVGRIVVALLRQDSGDGEEPLLPATLNRIVADLEKMRDARGWLSETSRVVTNRFEGIGHGSGPRPFGEGTVSTEQKSQDQRPDIRPDLLLRNDGDDRWTLVVDVPNFRNIASLNPDIMQFLRKTRSRLNGDSVKRPASWILSGKRRAALKDWPDPSKPLVNFENSNGIVDHLLESGCRMSPGPIWLFRIGAGGIAREIMSCLVRPNYNYILASYDEFDGLLDGMTPCAVGCSNICAIMIKVPQAINASYMRWLQERGLGLAKTIRVWPAGLPGRHWDGEGRGEWLTTEKPCIGIVPDHPIESYVVRLDEGAAIQFQAGILGQPTCIQLPQLKAGSHRLNVYARSNSQKDLGEQLELEGYLELRVREPEPWIPGTTSHAGLVVTSNPYDATLDVFWENEMDLTVFGPEGRQVIPHVSLEDARGKEIFSAQVCSSMDLPIQPNMWKKRFSKFLEQKNVFWRYLEASSGLLTIDGHELGRLVLRFDHEALPVRWVHRHCGEVVSIRLVDDSGQESPGPKCRFISMATPTKIENVEVEDAISGFEVKSPGGLCLAQNGKFWDKVVVSTGLSGSGLAGLGIQPKFARVANNPNSIIRHMAILRYWTDARLTGFLASTRRREIANGMITRLFGALGGYDWGKAETDLVRGNDRELHSDRLLTLFGKNVGFAITLRRDAANIVGDRKAISEWFAELAVRYGICYDKSLCVFAVDIASRPQDVPRLYGDELSTKIRDIMARHLLLRGARIVALSHAYKDDYTFELLPSWE